MPDPERFTTTADALSRAGAEMFPGYMGFEVVELAEGRSLMRCEIQPHHLAPNGYLHAGVVVALADTAAGYGCVANFPDGATGFTTVELKTNFFGTMLEGAMVAEATMVHAGRTTQVWDSEVRAEDEDRVLGLFRCTQLILYPRPSS